MLNHTLHLLQQHGFESIWCFMRLKVQWRKARTVEQLQSSIRWQWDNSSHVQRRLQTDDKGERVHSDKHEPVPTFMRCFAAIKFKMSEYFSWNRKLSQFKHLICFVWSMWTKRVYGVCKSLHSVLFTFWCDLHFAQHSSFIGIGTSEAHVRLSIGYPQGNCNFCVSSILHCCTEVLAVLNCWLPNE